jgi:quercetin dioxygenase-like cupin family protein
MVRKKAPSCDWAENKATKKAQREKNRIYRHNGDYTWTGIRTEQYKPDGNDWSSIVRRVLIGGHGEKTRFHVRYFEISSGGFSSFEKHRHEHVVIPVRGKGLVTIDKKKRPVGFLDTVYIKPDTPHQLSNPFDEPFGFLCIVNARRDRPVIL